MSGEGDALCRTGADQKMHEMQEEQLLALHFPSGNVHCLLLPGRSVANQLKIKKNENRNDKKENRKLGDVHCLLLPGRVAEIGC